jgi:hypothetical protein
MDNLIELANNGLLDIDSALLQDLSNYGHTVAGSEEFVEEFLNQSLTENRLLTTTELEETAMMASHELVDFRDTLSALNASTEPMDPAALALVNTLADQIVNMAEDMDTRFMDIYDYQTANGEISPDLYDAVLTPDASGYTNLHSAVICNVGDYEDTGDICH